MRRRRWSPREQRRGSARARQCGPEGIDLGRRRREARGIKTKLPRISGRGRVVLGKLITPDAKRRVIFYAHYDGQPVDAAAWTDGKPSEPVLRDASIEAGGKRIPFPGNSAQHRA